MSSNDFELMGGPLDGDSWRVPPGNIRPQVIRVSRNDGPKHLYTTGEFISVRPQSKMSEPVYMYEGPA